MRLPARGIMAKIARELSSSSKEAARALPDSKGGETAKQLQTYRTDIYTYFTRATGRTDLLYSAENWVNVKLTLETAGPVAIGTQSNIQPVLSGHGRLLDTGDEYETDLPKGTRLYIISETVNRISVTIAPIPWLEQISNQQAASGGTVQAAIDRAAQLITDAIAALRTGRGAITSRSGDPVDALPPPPAPPALSRQQLQTIIGPKRIR